MSIKNKFKNLFTIDDEFEYMETDDAQGTYDHASNQQRDNVVNLQTMQQPASKVVLCEPRAYNEVQEIADQVVNKRAVIVNLQRLDQSEARRIVDFLSGTVYAVDGVMQKLDTEAFLCAPENISVSGTITESLQTSDDFSKGWS